MFVNILYWKFYLAIIFLFSFFELYSCTNSNKNINHELNPYFPISETGGWKYINEAPRKELVEFQIKIVNITEQDQDYIVELSSFPFFDLSQNKTNLRITKNGEVLKTDSTGSESLFLPETSTIVQNNSWSFFNWNAYVTSFTDDVKTEDTTYSNCLLISFSLGFTYSTEIWFAKNTGIVKWGFNRTNPPVLTPVYYILKRED